jgi:hypothetical protein
MNLTALPAFVDNCLWMLDGDAPATVVDPGEPGPVAEALDARRLELAAILMTQRHAAIAGPANTGGHITFAIHTGGGEGIALSGARLFSAGRAERTWKNHFR